MKSFSYCYLPLEIDIDIDNYFHNFADKGNTEEIYAAAFYFVFYIWLDAYAER